MPECKNCKKNKRIVNKFFNLCLECNNERLHGSKYGKQYKHTPRRNNAFKLSKNSLSGGLSEKAKLAIEKDEKFYEECFNLSNHRCEECDAQLNTEFRDDDGRIIMRIRYSHILPKSTYPRLRHNVLNINHLCGDHHSEWENGDKENMKIFKKNKERICELRKL